MLSNTDITTLQTPEAEVPVSSEQPGRKGTSAGGKIARAAIVLMAGTVLSRVLGVGRESTIATLFGGGAQVDAFTIANHVATIVYDLLIAGTVSAALVPVLSEYTADEKQRPEFARVLSSILTMGGLFLLLSVAVLEIFAQPLVSFMCADSLPETCGPALTMTQWVLPGVLFMGLSGIVTAAHYALGRFVYPALTSTLFNAAIIFCAFALVRFLGVKSLAVGLVVGSFAMLALQVPGLRDIRIRPTLDWSHPAVGKIMRLYAPVGLSVVVTSGALIIDRNLASQTGEGSISAMRYATTLVQFALGLVAAAISLASLPSLSQHFSTGNAEGYKRTLAAGLRMVMVMVLPAAAGLFALAAPVVALFFRYGEFNLEDQRLTVQALLFYVPGLPFSALDQVLIFAFYARKNTLTPVLVGIAAVGVYLLVAFGTVSTMGMAGLVLANSVQLAFHAVVTGLLLWRVLGKEGGLRGYGIGETMLKAGAAALLTALVAYGVWVLLSGAVSGDSFAAKALLLGVPAVVGAALYGLLVWRMRLPEVELIAGKIVGRLRR